MTEDATINPPRKARSAVRRQHLLDTARNLFVERGFHQTGMAQIAAASGIAVGQIYRDFANKEAIIAAICESDMASWLEEEKLEAAVASGDTREIMGWIDRIGTEELCADDRRLMCDLLAEVGRNPLVDEMSRKADARVRTNLEAALTSLAPTASAERRATLMDFIIALSWGLMANVELSPDREHDTLRAYVIDLLEREVAALKEDK